MDRYGTVAPESARVASILNVLAGIWLIIVPFIVGFSSLTAPMVNSIVLGAVVLILAAIRASNPLQAPGLSWINLLLGIWLIISPWVVGFAAAAAATHNTVIFGIVVGVLAIWNLVASVPTAPATRV
jgi:uncharacterized membrane protein HdeD (DUF308 family)